MTAFESHQMVLVLADNIRHRYNKESLNDGEFAQYIGRTRQYVCRKIRKRTLPGYQDGREYIIPVSSIALLELNASGAASAKQPSA